MTLYTIRNESRYYEAAYADANRASYIKDRLNNVDSNTWRVETWDLSGVGSVVWYPHLTIANGDSKTTHCGDIYSWISELKASDPLWHKIETLSRKYPNAGKSTKYDIWIDKMHLKIEMLRVVRDIREEVGC